MVQTKAVKHRGPAQRRVLDNDVILLRQVDFKRLKGGLVDMLAKTPLRAGEPEGDFPWFPEGYIAAEQPRDYQMSVALLGATKGFAIAATDTGEILAQFKKSDYVKAWEIADKAQASRAVNIMIADEADENSEADEEDEGEDD